MGRWGGEGWSGVEWIGDGSQDMSMAGSHGLQAIEGSRFVCSQTLSPSR